MKRFAYLALAALTLCLSVHVEQRRLEVNTAHAIIARWWSVTVGAASPFTGTAPSATACDYKEIPSGTSSAFTKGLPLIDCSAYYVCIAAANAQTLSGGGNLDMYFWEPGTPDLPAGWTRASNSDEAMPAAASGKSSYCFPARQLPKGAVGCVWANANAVTTSGGATVTLMARCIQ